MTFRRRKLTGFAVAAVAALALCAVPAQAVQERFGFVTAAGYGARDTGSAFVAPVPRVTPLPRLETRAPKKPASSRMGVFNSVAISAGAMPALGDWRKVQGRDYTALYGEDCNFGSKVCNSRAGNSLRRIAREASAMPQIDALKFVNRAVNKAITYRDDAKGWGRADYWADPTEIAARGFGDCEDYAIAKMWMLRSMGFDEDQLQLVVLKNTRSGAFHAVLAVHMDGRSYVLDNLTNNVGTDDLFISYVPIVSFAAEKSYIHGFKNKRSSVAVSGGLGSIIPGGGI